MALQVRNLAECLVRALVTAWNAKQEASVNTEFHADITQLTSGDGWMSQTVTSDTITGDAVAIDVDATVDETATSTSADVYSGAEILTDATWLEPDYMVITCTGTGAFNSGTDIVITGTYLGAAVTDTITTTGTGAQTLYGDQLFDPNSITQVDVAAQAGTGGTIAIGRANIPEAIDLVNEEKLVINRHFADTRAHNTAVSAALSSADATSFATANTLASEIRTDYGTHLSESGVHFNNDSTNTISAAAATTIPTLIALVNEVKTDFNAHVISAPKGYMLEVVDP